MAFLPYSIRGEDNYNDEFSILENVQGSELKDPELLETSEDNETIDYTELVKEHAFIGEYPYDAIIEGLEEQFSDYMHLEDDNTNYVDVFYNQLEKSYAAITDDEEEHPEEKRSVLDSILNKFIDTMAELFNTRLTLTFMDIDGDMHNYDDIEYVIRKSYEFFILNARTNFLRVISAIVYPQVKDIQDDKEYFAKVNELIDSFNPLFTSIGPIEFLKYAKDEDMLDLVESNKVIGNFLRKYSPKLYQNNEFKIDIINNITTYNQFLADLQESANL